MGSFTNWVFTVMLSLAVYQLVSGKKAIVAESDSKTNVFLNHYKNVLRGERLRAVGKVEAKEKGAKLLSSRAASDKNSMKDVPDCHVNVTLEGSGQGSLNSPFYPLNYLNDLDCMYYIHTEPGYVTQLNFEGFSLEDADDCAFDFIQIFVYNGSEAVALTERRCGIKPPMLELIEQNLILIHFKSDFSATEQGFSVFYRVFEPGERCMFGPEEGCAFPCHCADNDICSRDTGACACKNKPPQGDFVGDQWVGIGCQTGNVALNKPATQSGVGVDMVPGSTALHPMSASQATDGYTGLEDWVTHCAWVKNEDLNSRAWWIVDLGDLYQVNTVIVYNTGDLEKYETLSYISVKHSRDNPTINIMQGCSGKMSPVPLGGSYPMECPMVARYIGIERIIHPNATNPHSMALCEVKVIGHKYYNVDCSENGNCEGNCYPGLFCDECKHGYKKPGCVEAETEATNCGMPALLDHGHVEYNDTWTGALANYSCEAGFVLEGMESVICSIEGEWMEPPTCARVDCGTPPMDDSAESLEYRGTLYEDMVMYFCADGYKLVGEKVLHCTENATWDNSAPKCEVLACGQPPDVEHAYLSEITGNVVDSVATYACEEGYLPNGEMRLKCDTDTNWIEDGLAPVCTGVPCKPPPPPPEHGLISFSNGTTFTSVVEYKCEENYHFVGVESGCFTSTCTEAGKWVTMPPECVMECGGLLTERSGVITTPNWPEPYDSNRKCSWLIKAPRPGDTVAIRFTDFDVEPSKNCSYDRLNLYDSSGSVEVMINTFCGGEIPPTISTVGNYLLLEFISDPAEEGKGFRAEYAMSKAESMEDVRDALEAFYPELLEKTMVESDLGLISHAITYLKSYMLTMEDSFEYAECLFLLEAEDGIENILYYHSVPRLKQYLYNTFDRAIYHIPRTYHTAQVIMDLIQHDNLTQVYSRLTDPLVALQKNIQNIVGMDSFRPEPVLFSSIEAPLLDKMVEHHGQPAQEIVMFMVDILHDLVLEKPGFDFKIDMLNCPAVEQSAVNLIHALENATQSLALVMGVLPDIIDAAFGPGADDIVAVYKEQLIEQLHILQHPFHVLIGVRDEVLRTFTLVAGIGEPTNGTTVSEMDVRKYMESTEPITADWLAYTIEENLAVSKLSFIMKDVEHFLFAAAPHAFNEPIEETSLVAFELMVASFYEIIIVDMPGYCLDGKLTAMLVGFMEIHLVDIAMSDLNISTISKEIAGLVIEAQQDQDDQKSLEEFIGSKLRARLFNLFRERLLLLENTLQEVTRGPVSTETLPMDVAVIIAAEKPKTMGDLIIRVIEIAIPALMVNVSCANMNWTNVDYIIMDFVQSFDDLTAEVLQGYEDLNLTQSNLDIQTVQQIQGLISSVLTEASDHLIHSFRQLRLVRDNEEDKEELVTFFIENLALALYNVIHMVKPNNPGLDSKMEAVMEVIEWQHSSFQEMIVQYMQGLTMLLDKLKDEDFDPCEQYPHICKLSLLDSLTTKREKCLDCGK